MQKYVIERDLAGAGKLSASELKAISQKSRDVLRSMGTKIQWVQSYVTDDKLYCVYVAPDTDIIFEHARCGGFPAETVTMVSTVIDPSTGEVILDGSKLGDLDENGRAQLRNRSVGFVFQNYQLIPTLTALE